MPLSASDLIFLPYTPDLTQAGIASLCRSLAQSPARPYPNPFYLQCRVAAKAAELAFQRGLSDREISFSLENRGGFSDPDRAELRVNGQRCELIPTLLNDTDQIRSIRADASSLLRIQAAAPVNRLDLDYLPGDDLLVFAFLLGQVAAIPTPAAQAQDKGQPLTLLFPLPSHWAPSLTGQPLGPLVLKTNLPGPIALELGGLDEEGHFQNEQLRLLPRRRLEAGKSYASIAYLLCLDRIQGQVGFQATKWGKPHIVQPSQWINLWIDGFVVIVAGCLPRFEFRRKSRPFHPTSVHGCAIPPGMKLASLPMEELRPFKVE